jgi:hypothetical protein
MALRKGPWKMIFGPGGRVQAKANRKANGHPGHLFHLADDPGETRDLRAEKPEVVAELTALMEQLVNNGRSNTGETRHNDLEVNWRRFYQPESPQPDRESP